MNKNTFLYIGIMFLYAVVVHQFVVNNNSNHVEFSDINITKYE